VSIIFSLIKNTYTFLFKHAENAQFECTGCFNLSTSRVTRRFEKNHPIFQKVAQTVSKSKKGQNIYNKTQFESQKHLHQTPFETLNTYNKPCFETAYLGENVINLLKQKVSQNVTISLGHFIVSKNQNEPPKVAQLVKYCSISHPIYKSFQITVCKCLWTILFVSI
jgi:hypothetical protein